MLYARKKNSIVIMFLLVFSIILTFNSERITVEADAKTIVVPDDYLTITAAIGNASEGDTIFVKKGIYEEHSLVINKTLTLVGEDANTTIIKNIDIPPPWDPGLQPFPPPPLITIRVNSSNVKVSNFTINRAVGVFADGSHISDNHIESTSLGVIVNSHNNTITRNNLFGIGSEGFIRCSGSHNIIINNKINGSASSTYGAVYINGSYNLVQCNDITDTSSLSYGRVKVFGDENTIIKNILAFGEIRVDGTGNLIDTNIVAVLVTFGSNNNFIGNDVKHGLHIFKNEGDQAEHTFYHNNFEGDPSPLVNFSDLTETVFFDNGKEGNYWNDYTGKDANNDGIGDTPYIIGFNQKDNYPLMAPITVFDAGTWEWTNFMVDVISNSTVSSFGFHPEDALIRFNVEGEAGTTGFCRVTIPKDLLNVEDNWTVLVNGDSVTPTVNEDPTNTYLYFVYQQSTKTIEIHGTTAIPEFPSWAILPLLLAATLAAVIYRKLTQRAY